MEAAASVWPGENEDLASGRNGVHLLSEAFFGYLPSFRPLLLPLFTDCPQRQLQAKLGQE